MCCKDSIRCCASYPFHLYEVHRNLGQRAFVSYVTITCAPWFTFLDDSRVKCITSIAPMPCSNGRSWRNACVLNAAFDISTLVCTRGLRYSNTRSVAPRILNWCSLLHTASCNVIKRQASALGGVRMASPVDLTVSDDDGKGLNIF